MNICLLPIETLLDIFATIYDSSSNSPATIAVLARTCRAFKEPALNTLWKNVDGFKPLILCLPQGIKKDIVESNASQKQMSLKRPLYAKEWKIFNSYACRVKCLTVQHWHLDEVDDRVVKALVSALSPILLPNLRALWWYDNRDSFLPLLSALLSPTIRSMVLCTSPGACWRSSFVKSTSLVSLGARCPHIEEFTCPYDSDSGVQSDALWDALRCWSKLTHLDAGVLDPQALAYLASLPSLRSLRFISYGFQVVDGKLPKSIPTFTAKVDKVSITASSLPVLIRCLRNIRFMFCRSMGLHVGRTASGLPYDPLDMADLILALSECCPPTLEQFTIEFADLKLLGMTSVNELLFTEKLTDPRFVLGFSAISPLLPFSRLTAVDLSWFCVSAINDVMIQTMAQSWPRLEEIYLGNGAHWKIKPSLTFTGLVHLIRHCPRLRNIAMVFHASSIDYNSEPFSKTIPNKMITTISVGNSPIDMPSAVACQLHALLPNLNKVNSLLQHVGPETPIQSGWARVEDFLVVLVDGARLKQKQAQALKELEFSLLA